MMKGKVRRFLSLSMYAKYQYKSFLMNEGIRTFPSLKKD